MMYKAEISTKDKPPKKKGILSRIRRWFTVAGIFTAIFTAVFLVLLFIQPGDYEPLVLDYEQARSPSRHLTNEILPALYNNWQAGTAFELVITEQAANDMLARSDVAHSLAQSGLWGPQIRFAEDQLIFMTTAQTAGGEFVLTVALAGNIDQAGMMDIEVQTLRLGSADLVLFWPVVAGRMKERYLPEQVIMDDPYYWPEQMLSALLEGHSFEPFFSFAQMDWRIEDIRLSPGRLEAGLIPLK